jgi:hypothetical protein
VPRWCARHRLKRASLRETSSSATFLQTTSPDMEHDRCVGQCGLLVGGSHVTERVPSVANPCDFRRKWSGESPQLPPHIGQSERCCRPLGSDYRVLALCRSRAVRLDVMPSARVMRVAVVPPSPVVPCVSAHAVRLGPCRTSRVVPVITIVSDPGSTSPRAASHRRPGGVLEADRSSTTHAGGDETRLHRALLRRDVSSEGRTLSKAL